MRPRFRTGTLGAVVVALGAPLTPAAAQSYAQAPTSPPTFIECAGPSRDGGGTGTDAGSSAACGVDLATYIGRRVFDAHCASCHGSDALGSSFAPALPERVRRLDRAAFLRLLERGYPGAAGMLPRWSEIPDVDRYADDLWVYLRARGSGELPPGPVELRPDAAVR